MNTDKEIDTRGLNCPLPILKAKKALADLAKWPNAQSGRDRPRLHSRLSGLCQANWQ